MASLESYQAVKRRGSTWSLPGLLGSAYPSKPEPPPVPTTPDALESYWAFEHSRFRTIDEYVATAAAAGHQKRQSESQISASTRSASTSSTSLSTLVDGPPPPSSAQGTKMAGSTSSAASSFKQLVLRQRQRPRKAERPPDKAEVSINAAFYGASIHNESSSLIFPLKSERDSESASNPAPPPPSQHRRSLSMFTTRTRKTSSVSFSIGDKIETPSKPIPSSSSTSLINPGYSLLPASRSTLEFGGVVCESPMSSTLEVDKAIRAPLGGHRTRKTSFRDTRRGSCPPVTFPAVMADHASETASIRTVPAPRSILKRSSDTASLRSFKTGDPTPSFDEARRKLEVYAEATKEEEEEDDGSDIATASSVPVPSIRKASPPTSVRTTMSTASRISQMPKRAQTWVVDAGKGVTRSATAVGTALLDSAYPVRVQKRITLDERSRPTRSQSQWAIADHILREKTKMPERQRDPASDYHLWNAERLNLNWKLRRGEETAKGKQKEVEIEEPELTRPPSMISLDHEPLYMLDSSAWLDRCDQAHHFTPEAVDLVNPQRPTLTSQRGGSLPNPPTQARITFTRRAQSEPTTPNASQDTADSKASQTTSSKDTRFFKEDGKEINESPKSSLLLTPVSSNEPDAAAPTWSQESLTSTASSASVILEDQEAEWEKNPRLCASDDLDDELYNAVLNMNITLTR